MTPTPDLLQAAMDRLDLGLSPIRTTEGMRTYVHVIVAIRAALAEIAAFEAWSITGYKAEGMFYVKYGEARETMLKATEAFLEGSMAVEQMITPEELERLNHIRDRDGQAPLTMEQFVKACASVNAWMKAWRELESAQRASRILGTVTETPDAR